MFKLKKSIRKRLVNDQIYTNLRSKISKNEYYDLTDSETEELILLLIERIELQDKNLRNLKKMLGGKN